MVGMIMQQMPPSFFIEKMFDSLQSFPLLAVPFFILAGEIMQKGSMAQRLLDISRSIVGHLTGGMAQVTVITSLFFGALSGSSPATVAAIGGIMIPSMKKDGYGLSFSTAVSTSAGCLGVIIPPSVPLIIYGTTAGVSVGDLFIAGIIPGFVVGGALMITAYIIAKKNGYVGDKNSKVSYKRTLLALWKGIPALLVPVIVLGGIYGGIMTPTEAGVAAALFALLMEGLVLRTLNITKICEIFKKTTSITATILFIVATATVFGQILLFYRVPFHMASFLLSLSHNSYVIMGIIVIILLIAGMFMDALANILILTPLFLPIVKQIGMDPIQFGIVMIVAVAIGFLTPPVGVNLFVGTGISGLSIERLSVAVIPFLASVLIALVILILLPQLSLILI
jgi:C4-dicarboxylate transporter DctM subunit